MSLLVPSNPGQCMQWAGKKCAGRRRRMIWPPPLTATTDLSKVSLQALLSWKLCLHCCGSPFCQDIIYTNCKTQFLWGSKCFRLAELLCCKLLPTTLAELVSFSFLAGTENILLVFLLGIKTHSTSPGTPPEVTTFKSLHKLSWLSHVLQMLSRRIRCCLICSDVKFRPIWRECNHIPWK